MMKIRRLTIAGLLGGFFLLLGGCAEEEQLGTEPPSGWESAEARWWDPEADTSGAFQDMESLRTMGVEDEARTFATSFADLTEEQRIRTVKEDLILLYRNEPQVVDSIFESFAVPQLQELPPEDQQERELLKQEAYDAIRKHFREPTTRLTMGEDVPFVYPDSLQQQGVEGEVYMQVRLDEEGVPQAIELLEGVHPTLDALAMNAASQMRWEPAAIYHDGEWVPVASWVRYSIPFRPPTES